MNNAQLSTVTGLRAEMLAGTVLTNTKLPDDVAEFDQLKHVGETSRNASTVFFGLLAASLYSWLTIATTTDVALITGTVSSPLPIINTNIMPAKRLPMRQVGDVLRLKHACGMSDRVIARSLGLGRTTVGEYLRRASGAGLGWPLPAGLSDADLERLLFPAEAARAPHRPQPNWAAVHAELKRPGVTLRLLWEEYRGAHPDGYSLSRFTEDGEPGPDLAAADLALPASIGVESDPTGGCRSPAVGPVRPSPEGGRLGRIRWPG